MLTRPIPPQGPPKDEVERYSRLQYAVTVAAIGHTTRMVDFKFFYSAARIITIVLIWFALQFVEISPSLAWWACIGALAVLLVELAFNPIKKALWHCVRASKLGEVGAYMESNDIPQDEAGLVKWWHAKAKNAGLNHSEFQELS